MDNDSGRAPIKAPFPYFGGKSRVAAAVWERFGDAGNYVEPFAGSLAVLLGRSHPARIETINDLDASIANFWRAVQADPDAVAQWADWPVNEVDLYARHLWLVNQGRALVNPAALEADPDYYDAKVAGWWVWGISQWIGSGWCAARGANPAAADAAGSWTLVDDENVTFDVVLAADGGAVSNWSKGPHGARGESGHWVMADGRIVIDYVDGWRDVILRKPTGELAKRSWGPGVARDAAPSNFGQAVRTPASYASWIGVYELPVAQSTTGEKFAIAIQSSHVAWKSIDEVKVGCWWIADGFLRIRWANGWCDELHTLGADYEVRSWKPGTPADANGRPTGAPTNTGRASRAK